MRRTQLECRQKYEALKQSIDSLLLQLSDAKRTLKEKPS